MADEPRYSDELRIPVTVTLPWSGRLTSHGGFWPQDAKGRDWPAGRDGEPTFPVDLLPRGFAPGTSEMYQPSDGRRVTERFAAIDAAMRDEMLRAEAAVRASGNRGTVLASQAPIEQVAEHDLEEEKEEEEHEDKRLLPLKLGGRDVTGPLNESTPAADAVRLPPSIAGGAVPPEDQTQPSGANHPESPAANLQGAPAGGRRTVAAGEASVSSGPKQAVDASNSSEPARFSRTQAELDSLARDPSHRGQITPKTEQERRVGLDLEAKGIIPGKITRDPTGAAEFIDGKRQKWDVKSFRSNRLPRKGGFDKRKDADKVDKSLDQGENVIVDTSNMTAGDIAALKSEGGVRNWGNKVVYWP